MCGWNMQMWKKIKKKGDVEIGDTCINGKCNCGDNSKCDEILKYVNR